MDDTKRAVNGEAKSEEAEPISELMTNDMEVAARETITELKSRAENYKYHLEIDDLGIVTYVGNEVVLVSGLPQAMLDELLEFPDKVYGLTLNLERNEVGCLLVGSEVSVEAGDRVRRTGRMVEVPVGEALLGRVVNPLGEPLDEKGPIRTERHRFIEGEAPSVIDRDIVNEPMQTGIKIIDAILSLGRGQRELIIGDRDIGKTAIAIDAIINQRDTGMICIYVGIGQRKAAMARLISVLEEYKAMEHTIVIMADADDPPAMLYLAPYAGCAMAEEFMFNGRDVLIVYDDLTKHADAYREISLLLRRPPGREAYPADIFYLHSRLLERAGKLNSELGGGSMTALPIVETKAGNISAYIPTNIISITDGQIYLDLDLFNEGFRPAIDIGLSVSRVSGAQTKAMKSASGHLRLDVAQYQELASFSKLGTELNEAARRQLIRGEHIMEILKQPQYSPMSVEEQVAIISIANQGYLDDLPLDQVKRFENELLRYLREEAFDILRKIRSDEFTEEIQMELEKRVQEFKKIFSTEER